MMTAEQFACKLLEQAVKEILQAHETAEEPTHQPAFETAIEQAKREERERLFPVVLQAVLTRLEHGGDVDLYHVIRAAFEETHETAEEPTPEPVPSQKHTPSLLERRVQYWLDEGCPHSHGISSWFREALDAQPTYQPAPSLLVERVREWIEWSGRSLAPWATHRSCESWFQEALEAEETAVEQARKEERERCLALALKAVYSTIEFTCDADLYRERELELAIRKAFGDPLGGAKT